MEETDTFQLQAVRVSAYLPFRLEEGPCAVKVNNKIIQLNIENPERPFFNPDGLLSDDLGRLWRADERDPRSGFVLYSSIATHEIHFSDATSSLADNAFAKRIVRQVTKAVEDDILPAMNKLVDVVRIKNDAPFLPPIRFFHLRIEPVSLPPNGRLEDEFREWLRGDNAESAWYRRFPWSKYVRHLFNYHPDEKLLVSDSTVDATDVLFANAEQLFGLGQYSSAVVVAHSALDATVSSFISAQFDLRGVSNRDTEKFLINNGLPDKLDLVLKLLFHYNIKDDSRLWSSFSKMNSVRNDIVHRGKVVPDKDAEEMMTISRAIVALISTFSAKDN
jgi:hypothetical protein